MILATLPRDRIIEKPMITLDVKLVVFKHPSTWPAALNGLAQLEYNYFELKSIELIVTPLSVVKIFHKKSIPILGFSVYERVKKKRFDKDRPHRITLKLTKQEANDLWFKIRNILWPKMNDNNLTINQKVDNTQLFYHLVVSGCSSNSTFVTIDKNFLKLAEELNSELGLSIMSPKHAWVKYQQEYNLYIPDEKDVNWMWQHQHYHLGNFLYVLKN